MHPSVALLLVSHDGSRWLPNVLDGIRAQQVQPTRVVAVDTGSRDASVELLETAFPDVLHAPSSTSFPAAVELGLAHLRSTGPDPEWVWLLHDDANPEPGALAALLAAAEEHPGAAVLGPKLREWPSLRRLLELGVTISATGRRETGLERGEYDQGQHDDVRRVLAVNTAGMLVRRSALEELGGFDDRLAVFGNDIDFGWRATQAGHQALIVPDAVVFHAEAAHRGTRRTELTGRHTHFQERRAALYTLLVNARGRALPFTILRLGLGTLLRVLGFVLVRAGREALDELTALVSTYAHPGEIRAGRRERREAHRHDSDPAAARGLLAPWWLPYRHGLDFVTDLTSAASDQASDVAGRRRAAAAEHDPASFAARRPAADDDVLADDTGAVARFLSNPVAVLLALFVVAALVGARSALGAVSGGGLSAAPEGVGEWWSLYLSSHHALGQGSSVPAPPYLAPLALLASVLGGSPAAAVSVVLVFAVPVGLWGAWRFLRVTGRLVSPRGAPRWLVAPGAAAYALVPVVSGGWGDGRLGVVVGAALLPWAAHAALGFAEPEADRRWRAAWRCGLLLAVIAAFTPLAWLLALVLAVVVLGAAFAIAPKTVRGRSVWGPPAVAFVVVPVLLAPWWLPALLEGAGRALLLDAGRQPAPFPDGLALLTGRLGDTLGAPQWWGLVLPVLALVALVPRATRIPVLVCWVVALVAAATAAVLATAGLELGAVATSPGSAFPLVLLQGAFAVAAVLGVQGAAASATSRPLRVAGVALAVVVAVVPLAGLVWFVAGDGDRLTSAADAGIPAYMVQSSLEGPEHGILVVRGSVADGLSYTVRRGDGVTLGEDEITDLTPEDTGFTNQVRALASRPTPAVVDALARSGIEYVVLPAPADGEVAASLDATGGLVQASAEDRTTRAWQTNRPLSAASLDGPRSWLRVGLLVISALGIVGVAVLCLPSLRRKRVS